MKLLGQDWSYINEGNAHIVLQLKGTDFVLRIIKEDGKSVDLESVQNSVNFIDNVMHPLLFDDFKYAHEVKTIPLKELDELREALLTIRPENRIIKSVLSKYAIQTLNLTLVSPKCETNYCIEIKPKEGFLPSSLKPLAQCYYCLKQYIKLETGAIKEKSSYCPLDLFSGNIIVMRHALIGLVENPQNNLKFFENGVVVYDADSKMNDFYEFIQRMGIFHSVMQFLHFIIEILMKDPGLDFKNMFRETESYPVKENKCIERYDLWQEKYFGSVLHRLLDLQKLSEAFCYDTVAIEDEGTEYVDTIRQKITSQNFNINSQVRKKILKTFTPVQAALISAVAKDCSIMISFTPNFMEGFPFIEIGNQKISYRLAVTDLEPKTTKTLVKRRDNEIKMIDAYKYRCGIK